MATTVKSIATNPTIPNYPRNKRSYRSRSSSSIISLLKLCKNMKELQQIHANLIKTSLIHDMSAVNAIIEFSVIHENLVYALSVFETTPHPTLFAKNFMIRGHAQSEFPLSAITFYVRMLSEGFELNKFGFSFLIQACLRSQAAEEGKQIHGQILKFGKIDAHLASSIICFYSEIQDLDSAHRAFESDLGSITSWNAMIDGYSKSGDMEMARRLFDEMPQKTLIAWTALITGFVHLGRFIEALEVFETMQRSGFRPDERTLVSVLPSISHLGALSLGKWVHSYAENSGMESSIFLRSALVDMYSKCGSIENALELFEKMGPTKRNVVMWNAMIGGLAMHGHGRDALELFQEMLASGTKPTDVTFVGVLRACSHAGMVDKGLKYFEAMKDLYELEPTTEHYGCMVDLLGRAGRLQEAEGLVRSMSGQPDVVVLKTLLGACRVYGNVDIGERIGRELLQLASDDSSCYVLLANLYASVGRWVDAGKVRNLMKERGVKKIAGCSSIELDNVAHEFHAGDMSHPQIKEIYATVEEMGQRLKVEEGYTPDTSQVLADIDEEEKETALYRHSEKLAIAFGLINTIPGSTIRIVKNLRVCLDCHSVTKLVSKLYGREIIVRDQNRFHHFKNGVCSCNEYW
ncbi:pentatricopeptide repeat-containing protein At5g48910-like [Magnolia sinica]|uniref:pentatricopeptide repeat-containing protein At5g48910-like n=1 Tax=Magnolia sinica TaxID=86752 RepID=UPI002658A21C|nr:pentatricopeptide repeat-containing protein At5g48910-like [Magnolia sinica]